MAVIACLAEYRYHEAAPIVNLLIERFHAIEATMNQELLGASPTIMSPRIVTTDTLPRRVLLLLRRPTEHSWPGPWNSIGTVIDPDDDP